MLYRIHSFVEEMRNWSEACSCHEIWRTGGEFRKLLLEVRQELIDNDEDDVYLSEFDGPKCPCMCNGLRLLELVTGVVAVSDEIRNIHTI